MKTERNSSNLSFVKTSAGVVCASLLLSAGAAGAAVLVNDNFDAYANQAAFQSVWTPVGTAVGFESTQLSTAQASSGPNAVRLPAVTTAEGNNRHRNRLDFTPTGLVDTTQLIIWSFDFYDGGAAPARNYVNLQSTALTGHGLISIGLNNNQTAANSGGDYFMARILNYTTTAVDPDGGPNESVVGLGAYFKLNDFGAGLRSVGWHNLRVEISTDDGLSTDFAFYVNGVLAERVSNLGSAADFRSYSQIVVGSGLSNNNTEAFVDNMRLEVAPVPEPGAFAFAALGIGALIFMRKFRR